MAFMHPRRFNATRTCGLVILFYFLILLLFPYSHYGFWVSSWRSIANRNLGRDFYSSIWNETLGFGQVFAIGLKDRTDKRDFLSLAAFEAGFKVDWIDGVRPKDLNPSALPNGYNLSTIKPTVIACWRAHMNALNRVLENSLSTALIIEDDADWDVSLRLQLREFARSIRVLNGENHAPRDAPYGTNWDILWIGGCASEPASNETTFFAIPDDPTVPNPDVRSGWGGPLETWKVQYPQLSENTTRFIYKAEMGCCTYGYAVSAQGAKKILAAFSTDHINCAVDNAMSDLCAGNNGYPKLNCFASWPNLIGTYKQSGPASRDSDIEDGDAAVFHEAASWNMVYSTRLNIQRLVQNQKTVLSQHKSKRTNRMTELSLDTIQYPSAILIQ